MIYLNESFDILILSLIPSSIKINDTENNVFLEVDIIIQLNKIIRQKRSSGDLIL